MRQVHNSVYCEMLSLPAECITIHPSKLQCTKLKLCSCVVHEKLKLAVMVANTEVRVVTEYRRSAKWSVYRATQ